MSIEKEIDYNDIESQKRPLLSDDNIILDVNPKYDELYSKTLNKNRIFGNKYKQVIYCPGTNTSI
jgi:hypothetical protein